MINFFLAEKYESLGPIGEGDGFGPWAEEVTESETAVNLLAKVISYALGVMTIGAGIWFLFQTIIAGYNYMNAAGDKTRIENAGRRLTNAIIGLALVVAAYGILALVGNLLGIEFLNVGKLFSLVGGAK
jgi:hypothetical protein